MSSHNGARGGLPRPYEGFPAYGAVHEVIPNEQLRGFMFDFSRIADGVFTKPKVEDDDPLQIVNELDESFTNPEASYQDDPTPSDQAHQIITKGGETSVVNCVYDSRQFYRVFDPENLGVSVVEMDASQKAAKLSRKVWERNDLGAVENEAKSEMGRHLPDTVPHLLFNRVESVGRRLPGVPKGDVRQKIALMPDTNRFMETFDLIEGEADIIIAAIKRRLKQFVYPWDITPHLTFAAFRSRAEVDQIVEVKERANEYLAQNSVGIRLGELVFRHRLVRKDRD